MIIEDLLGKVLSIGDKKFRLVGLPQRQWLIGVEQEPIVVLEEICIDRDNVEVIMYLLPGFMKFVDNGEIVAEGYSSVVYYYEEPIV